MVTLMPRGHLGRRHRSLRTSSGVPPEGVEILIVDEERKPCPTGVPGQIAVAGPNVVNRYFAGDGDDEAFEQGFFYTADTGYLDARGHLHVLGRRDDMILTGGEMVAPAEVEAALRRLPFVKDVAVLGIPDTTWGERVAALVTTTSASTPDLRGITEALRPLLAGYKLPTELRIVSDLPLTPAGKLARCRLPYLWEKARQS